jgi:enoyl-CoA hydratase
MSEVRLEVDGGVAVVTLAAADRRNALTPAMARELTAVLTSVGVDSSIGATVIRGDGGTFCAGADRGTISAAVSDPVLDETYQDVGAVYETFAVLESLPVPTIAAIRGHAVGAGLNLAMAADVRIVARTAILRSGFLRIGVHPGGGHFTLLGRAAGRGTAAAMTLFGCDVTGERAAALGLAWEAVEDSEAEQTAIGLARVAARDPALAREAVRHLRMQTDGAALGIRAASELERSAQLWSFRRQRQP